MNGLVEFAGKELMFDMDFIEARYWSMYYTRSRFIETHYKIIGNAFVGAVPTIDMLALNRVVGLGSTRESVETIPEIIDFYKHHGVRRFFVTVSPYATDFGLSDALLANGFKYYNNWSKLIRPSDIYIQPIETDLHIQRISADYADIYGEVLLESFGWTDRKLIKLLGSTVGKPGYKHYLIYKNTEPIAAGALFTHNQYAAMAFAGTLKEYRGQGAQTLLLKTRLEEAESAGCQIILSETAEDTPEKPVQSFRNMRKAGFELAFNRENWIYEF